MFECEYCGWSIDGGDEIGLQIYDENDNYRYEIDYCFHCGHKVDDAE